MSTIEDVKNAVPQMEELGRQRESAMPRMKSIDAQIEELRAERDVLLRTLDALSKRDGRPQRFVDEVRCAYCLGTGVDSNSKYGHLCRCPVCGGASTIAVKSPVVSCLKCSGTGRERGMDLTCLACKGTGVVSVHEDATTCPECKGTGKHPAGLYCTACTGQGIV